MLLDGLACFVIPAYTLLFAGKDQWLTTNFSVLGSTLASWPVFALWSAIVGFYFYRYLPVLIHKMGGGRGLRRCVILDVLLLFCAVTTPYLPQMLPQRAVLHVLFGVASALLLLGILLTLLWRVWQKDPKLAAPYLLAMGGIAVGSAILLVIAGIVSTALEVFLVLTNVLLVRCMVRQQWNKS